ncbi:MAG: acyl-ACP thioesterase domain-containing protein [Dysgonamonadaceae bacterium]
MAIKTSYQYKIGMQDIDFRQEVSLTSLISYVLDAAGKNADDNGFGLLALQKVNYTWVISRFVIDMMRFPDEKEELNISTWVENVSTAFTQRNFNITDENNESVGYASSSWAVINMQTRQSILLDQAPELQRVIIPDSTPIGAPIRIQNVKGPVVDTFRVKYSDLDVNRHANTLNYVKWISDCFSLDFYDTHTLKRFEINFLKELLYGDEGEILMEMKTPNDYFFQLVIIDKGVVCRARLVFEEN